MENTVILRKDEKSANVVKTQGKKKSIPQAISKRYKDFKALTKQLDSVPFTKVNHVTYELDKRTLKTATYPELVKLANKFNARRGSNDFLTVARIKSHIKYRETNNNFVYERVENKKGEPTVRLINVK